MARYVVLAHIDTKAANFSLFAKKINKAARAAGSAKKRLAVLTGQTGHHALKGGLEAGFLAVHVADQAVHRSKLLLVALEQNIHARLQLGQVGLVFGILVRR